MSEQGSGSFARASNFTEIKITKPNRDIIVESRGKTIGFNYYESVYSPMITATMLELDAGGSVVVEDKDVRGTLKDALPVEGFERVSFVITSVSGELNFKKNPMVITGSPGNIDQNTRQSAFFPMVSRFAIENAKKPLSTIYPEAKISDTVTKILQQYKFPIANIEESSNVDKVSGDHDSPLDVILQLCKKSIPANGKDPGYFFFETQDGFVFKSIDGLIRDGIQNYNEDGNYKALHSYEYRNSLSADPSDDNKNNFKIMLAPLVMQDQDQLRALRNGKYNVRICTMNTLTHEYTERVENLLSSSNLGDKQETTELVDKKDFLKTYTYVINPGADEVGVSEKVINSPSNYEPKANMRYSLLHSQIVNVQVPCNVNLKAGDVIFINIENITQDDKITYKYNEHRSGFYLILHLCHHFDTGNSYTSMTLARDTYGKQRSTK